VLISQKINWELISLLSVECGAWTRVARLSSDGIAVVEKLANLKISNTSRLIDFYWHFKRGNRDYLIFSENDGDALYVARSSNGVLGPYEKSNQILIFGMYLIIENEGYCWNNNFSYVYGKVFLLIIDMGVDRARTLDRFSTKSWRFNV